MCTSETCQRRSYASPPAVAAAAVRVARLIVTSSGCWRHHWIALVGTLSVHSRRHLKVCACDVMLRCAPNYLIVHMQIQPCVMENAISANVRQRTVEYPRIYMYCTGKCSDIPYRHLSENLRITFSIYEVVAVGVGVQPKRT